MKHSPILPTVICLVALSLSTCAPEPRSATEQAPRTEADVEAIRAFLDKYEAIAEAGDAETYFTLWTDDVVFMPPNQPLVEGKEAVKEWARPVFEQFRLQETFSIAEIEVMGDWAFARGTYEYQATPRTGAEAIQQTGNIVYMLRRRADGPWQVARAIYNIAPSK